MMSDASNTSAEECFPTPKAGDRNNIDGAAEEILKPARQLEPRKLCATSSPQNVDDGIMTSPISNLLECNKTNCFKSASMNHSAKEYLPPKDDTRSKLNVTADAFQPNSAPATSVDRVSNLPERNAGLNVEARSFQPNFKTESVKRSSMNHLAKEYLPPKDDTGVKLNVTANTFQPNGVSVISVDKIANIRKRNADLSIEAKPFQPASHFATSSSLLIPTENERIESNPWDFFEAIHYSRRSISKRKPCYFFLQGACRKGKLCPFEHDAQGLSPKLSIISNKSFNSDSTTYRIESGISCRFLPGAEVDELFLNGQENASKNVSVSINGLSKHIADEDITSKLLAIGSITSFVRKHETYAFVKFDDGDCAAKAIETLSGSSSKLWIRSAVNAATKKRGHVKNSDKSHKSNEFITLSFSIPPGSIVLQDSMVKVMWYAPSKMAWAHFDKIKDAKEAARRCNKEVLRNRTLSVKFQTPSRHQRNSFSISIAGLDPRSSEKEIKRFISKSSKQYHFSLAMANSTSYGAEDIKHILESVGPLVAYHPADKQVGSLKRKALAKFHRVEDASKACNNLHLQARSELGGQKLFIARIFSGKVKIEESIYKVIRIAIDGTLKGLYHDCGARHNIYRSNSKVTIVLQADKAEAITAAKGKIMPHLLGHRMIGQGRPKWHTYLLTKEGDLSISQLNFVHKNAHVFCNKRKKEICLFGASEARRKLEDAVTNLLRLADEVEHATPLTPTQFSYCVREGSTFVAKIVTALKLRSISLDVSTKSLLVKSNTHSAKMIVGYIANKMAESGDASKCDNGTLCPICFCVPGEDEGDDVIVLDCKHEYCRDCFKTWIDRGQRCSFPLKCLLETCCAPIHVDQLGQVIPEEDLLLVLRAAIDDHVNKNLENYHFCLSPDCEGIYKIRDQRVESCSTCQTLICTKCNVEEHFGLTCTQYRMAKLPPNDLRNKVVNEILTLRCPRCQQAFFDFDGCFSIRCSTCQCSFCGWCLKDCGSDAHSHVKTCKFKPTSADSYFGTRKEFEAAQSKRQGKELKIFVNTLTSADRKELLSSLKKELKDLGIKLS